MEFTLKVNGTSHTVDVNPEKPLLWVLREDLGLTGTKYGCGTAICGTCTVLIDEKPTASCVYDIQEVGNQKITTIEGLDSDVGETVKEAWLTEEVSQCGYCQPGQILSATHLLTNTPNPTDDDIDNAMTGLCRCGTYQRIRAGIKTAVKLIED